MSMFFVDFVFFLCLLFRFYYAAFFLFCLLLLLVVIFLVIAGAGAVVGSRSSSWRNLAHAHKPGTCVSTVLREVEKIIETVFPKTKQKLKKFSCVCVLCALCALCVFFFFPSIPGTNYF